MLKKSEGPDKENGKPLQMRRAIVKDNQKLMGGKLNLKNLLNIFIKENYLNTLQYIQNIQIGIELSNGYGIVNINKDDIQN